MDQKSFPAGTGLFCNGTTEQLAEELRRVVPMSQGTTKQLAEMPRRVVDMSQGTTLQLAEKLTPRGFVTTARLQPGQ
jgi:hypothetical protein